MTNDDTRDNGEPTDEQTGIEAANEPSDGEGSTEPSAAEAVDGADGALDSVGRRDYMKAVGAAAAATAVGGAASSPATAETADTSLGIDERIQEHRTGDLDVTVENADGSTVSNADVSITQQSHAFDFGTAVNANTLINNSSEGDNYREYIPELFNTAVMENRHKWDFFENEQQLADEATQWILDQGLDMRGHVCLWGREDVSAIPSDIQTAIDNNDAQTIRDRSMQHIEDIITHYGDDLTEWEVVNEVMHTYQMQIGVYGDQIDTEEPWTGDVVPWTSDLLADWYSQAADVIEQNGYDLDIAVNDFNQFAYGYTDDRYVTQIQHLNDNGTDIDIVGLQAHAAARTGDFNSNDSPDGRISASQVVEEMNKWADLGGRLKITEFDTYNGDDWNSDQERADVLENYLRGAFSHPGCDAFIMWGFWDGRHWENEAPLFYEDWSEKPAYDVWTGLVFDEWWTDESGTTDGSGNYSTSAFLGEHEITVSTDSDEVTRTVSVTGTGGTSVTVTVDGEGTGTETPDDTETPDTETPDTETPDTETPDTETPDTETPSSGDLIASIDPGATSGSTGDLMQFWISDETGNGTWITDLQWELGDGTTDAGWYADNRYSSAGTYTVTLTATNNEGTTSTDEVTVQIS